MFPFRRALVPLAATAIIGGCKKPELMPSPPDDLPLNHERVSSRHVLLGSGEGVLGRFVASPGGPMDETVSRKTACSAFFGVSEQAWTDDEMSGLYTATAQAADRAGVTTVAPGEAYTLWHDPPSERSQVAGVTDPRALDRCCREQPDQCEPWYVARLHIGAGQVAWQNAVDSWRFGRMTEEAVPFAFELAANPYATEGCGSWQRSLPLSAAGVYFLGVSNATFTEANSRIDALKQSRNLALAHLHAEGLSDVLVEQISEERWCVDVFPGAGGAQYMAHVLVHLPTP